MLTRSLPTARCSAAPPRGSRASTVCVHAEAGKINTKGIRANEEKVADFVKVEDLAPKTVYCRCWKSDKFPLCDGQHIKHNKETGDNIGPLVIEKPKST